MNHDLHISSSLFLLDVSPITALIDSDGYWKAPAVVEGSIGLLHGWPDRSAAKNRTGRLQKKQELDEIV